MTTNSMDEALDKYIKDNVIPKKQKHTQGVIETAIELAKIYDADIEKARIAAKCHDICKNWDDSKMNDFVEKHGLGDKYLNANNLSHSKAAAITARERFGIEDKEILGAIAYHTTGRAGMSLLEKIIYIADAIEPNRKQYSGLEKLRAMAKKDINQACLMSLKSTKNYLEKRGDRLIDEDTLNAITWFESQIVQE